MQVVKFDRYIVATETGYGMGETLGEALHNVPNLVDEPISICIGTKAMIINKDTLTIPIGEPALEMLAQFILEPTDLHNLDGVGEHMLKEIYEQKQLTLDKAFVTDMFRARDEFQHRAPQYEMFRDPPLTIHRRYGTNKYE